MESTSVQKQKQVLKIWESKQFQTKEANEKEREPLWKKDKFYKILF